jgi:hypothetical protein
VSPRTLLIVALVHGSLAGRELRLEDLENDAQVERLREIADRILDEVAEQDGSAPTDTPRNLRDAGKLKEKSKEAEEALEDAERAAPDHRFVKSCREWYRENGFLTPKQIAALDKFSDAADRDDERTDYGEIPF